MPYKKKVTILSAAAVLLALVYLLTLFFDPQRASARAASFTWLSSSARDLADGMDIIRNGQTLKLVLSNGIWFAQLENLEVPVKQGRIDDLFRLLSTRGAFPRRGSSAASHEGLGLGEGASRLLVRGGAGLPLLDLFVGKDDPSGREVFLRKAGENEFRSGDKLIASYVNGEKTSWFDMKFFDEKSLNLVQRVDVQFNGYTGGEDPPEVYSDYTLERSGENWLVGNAAVDREKTETWLRSLLEAQGENILPPVPFDILAKITLGLGDGSVLSLQIGAPGEDGKYPALVNGKNYMFVLSPWMVTRLLRDRGSFF
ncbi:hypothetical protein AGMMS50230_19300 [Spirochaetia bacterium]|nr:hypothetical protein AGMMS50230_19300 [Spirochaetia bacterium]